MDYKRLRLGKLICWLFYGHSWDKTGSSKMMTRSMNTCEICGKVEAGPD